MPYDNQLNREIADQMRDILEMYIKNTANSYDIADGNIGYANKQIINDDNKEQVSSKLQYEENNLVGGALGSIGGFARGTFRDTGEGRTLGAGKKEQIITKEKELLLKRQLEGGNIGVFKKNSKKLSKDSKKNSKKNSKKDSKKDSKKSKKRGRPNKMKGGAESLAEPYNMIKKDGTTGNGKPSRQIGGQKVVPVANMQSSSMAGLGKGNEKRSDIVKRIMKERGVNMIKASSIVKAEGLFVSKKK
jgi:hypothetical protein